MFFYDNTYVSTTNRCTNLKKIGFSSKIKNVLIKFEIIANNVISVNLGIKYYEEHYVSVT